MQKSFVEAIAFLRLRFSVVRWGKAHMSAPTQPSISDFKPALHFSTSVCLQLSSLWKGSTWRNVEVRPGKGRPNKGNDDLTHVHLQTQFLQETFNLTLNLTTTGLLPATKDDRKVSRVLRTFVSSSTLPQGGRAPATDGRAGMSGRARDFVVFAPGL